jgi:hypothetical protein
MKSSDSWMCGASPIPVILDIRLARCRAYAESRGWEIAGIWLDLGDHALGQHRRSSVRCA